MQINSVTASQPIVCAGGSFTIDVNVTATDDDFEDGSAYRLYLFVQGANGPVVSTPIFQAGHVQEGFWTAPTSDFVATLTAGATPDLYTITAALIEGPKGVDLDGSVSIVAGNPVLVVNC